MGALANITTPTNTTPTSAPTASFELPQTVLNPTATYVPTAVPTRSPTRGLNCSEGGCCGNSKSDDFVRLHLHVGGCNEMAQRGLCTDLDVSDLLERWCEESCQVGKCATEANINVTRPRTNAFSMSGARKHHLDEDTRFAQSDYNVANVHFQVERDRMIVAAQEHVEERRAKAELVLQQRQDKREREASLSPAERARAIVDRVTDLHDLALKIPLDDDDMWGYSDIGKDDGSGIG